MDDSFDINQLPKSKGMILFGISMARIDNAQSAASCMKHIEQLCEKIQRTEGIGLSFLYADYLYMHTATLSARKLRNTYVNQMSSHKNGMLKLLEKNPAWIIPSFSFFTWAQLLLEFRDLGLYLQKIKEIYKKDDSFRRAIKRDAQERRLTQGQADFFLEEITVLYLLAKGVVSLPNAYINHHEQWVLNCYPGEPLESERYLYAHNLLGLDNPKNKYQHHQYNLSTQRLIDLR